MITKTIEYTYRDYKKDIYVWDLPSLKNTQNPGVYILKDRNDEIIYIGEASNLYTRIKDHINGKTLELGAVMVGNRKVNKQKNEYNYIYKIDLYIFDTQHQHDRYFLEIKLIRENNPVFNYKYRTNLLNQNSQKQYKQDKEEYMEKNIALRRDKWNMFQQRAIRNGNSYTMKDNEWVNALPKNIGPLELSVLQRVNNIFNKGFVNKRMDNMVNKTYRDLIDEITKEPSLKYKNEKEILTEAHSIGFCTTGKEEEEIIKLIPERILN